MIRFVGGVLLPFFAAGGWIAWSAGRFNVFRWREIIVLAILLLLLPAFSAWSAARLAEHRRRRAVVRRPDLRFVRLVCGVLTGALGLGLAALSIALFDRYRPDAVASHWPDAVPIAAAVFFVTLLVVALLPGRRAGLCGGCGYDIRGSLNFGRCPECGLAIRP